ncbi:MAG: ribosomal-protein-serine acetyltransferase [Bacteroidetes bacterium GWA2_31_9]|nr:MAG: ribosomal-protein-serine acetyltransferase [Bacteroidetes bacterium GWA2_31_9]
MEYKVLNNNRFQIDDFAIVPLREYDIYLIKDWRNSQMDVLRQKEQLSDSGQLNYYNNAIKPLFSQLYPSQILFSFLKENDCIGYGGLTNIDWESKRAELSFILDSIHAKNNELYEKEFSMFIRLIKKVLFEDLNFNRIFTETYDIRPHHISILEKNGFQLEGRMREHIQINNKFVDSLIHGFLKEYYHAQK